MHLINIVLQHKGHIAYNQPYVWGAYAFVFNGFIQGVRIPPGIDAPPLYNSTEKREQAVRSTQ
jgi:hypothetical protein